MSSMKNSNDSDLSAKDNTGHISSARSSTEGEDLGQNTESTETDSKKGASDPSNECNTYSKTKYIPRKSKLQTPVLFEGDEDRSKSKHIRLHFQMEPPAEDREEEILRELYSTRMTYSGYRTPAEMEERREIEAEEERLEEEAEEIRLFGSMSENEISGNEDDIDDEDYDEYDL